ncbi:hypothetical protein [Bradyrhizobium tropiciagri]|uniref:hypothetical protein n=1 Tax=Bradyrhizobium tropiciagri TaxID=312253 RepID=UPI00138F1445|nr:hypothetical protein [Bradyrhizobium tropiciagri]
MLSPLKNQFDTMPWRRRSTSPFLLLVDLGPVERELEFLALQGIDAEVVRGIRIQSGIDHAWLLVVEVVDAVHLGGAVADRDRERDLGDDQAGLVLDLGGESGRVRHAERAVEAAGDLQVLDVVVRERD